MDPEPAPETFPADPVVEPVIPPPARPRRRWLVPVIGLLLGLGLYGAYRFGYLQRFLSSAFPSSPAPSGSSQPALTAYSRVLPLDQIDPSDSLVYLRDPDSATTQDLEAWLLDPGSGREKKLDLPALAEAYKYYGNPVLYYKPMEGEGIYRILNLETGQETTLKLITHPDPVAIENVRIQDLREISPDGRYFVFMADFFTICPSPSPFPSGFEGGFGPCQPEASLETPFGYYVYDVLNQKATFLAEYIRVSRWDTANRKLYYVEGSATKLLDLNNLTESTVDASPHFGYFTYPLLAKNKLLKNEAGTGNSGEAAFGRLTLVNLADQSSVPIDSVDAWAVLQPFMTATPAEDLALYIRTTNITGLHRDAIYRYPVDGGSPARVTPADDSLSFNLRGDWLSQDTYVVMATKITGTDVSQFERYLVKINVRSGELTRLTPHRLVFSFNGN